MPLATPEDILVMKAVARRPRDFADIEAIVTAQDQLDLARVRMWVREFSQALAMPDVLADFEQALARAAHAGESDEVPDPRSSNDWWPEQRP